MVVKQTANLRNANSNQVNFQKKMDEIIQVIQEKPSHMKSIDFIDTPIKDLLKSEEEVKTEVYDYERKERELRAKSMEML